MLIYEIVNTVNGKRYVGQTIKTLGARTTQHKNKLNKNCHSNKHLQSAWNKYGMDAFQFRPIADADSQEKLNTLEKHYIELNQGGYNILAGGARPSPYVGKVDSLQKRLSKSKRARPQGFPDVVTPAGDRMPVEGARIFAKENNLSVNGVRELLFGRIYHFKGWRLCTPETEGMKFIDEQYSKNSNISKGRRPQGFPTLITPTGDLVPIKGTLTHFCKQHNLSLSNISQLINGKKDIYMGWTVNTTEN